jgi:drug/metabolite transporter (DMT)-like permease
MRGKYLPHLALFGANLIYGVNYTIAKIALPEHIQSFGFIFIRVSVALLLFWAFHLHFKEKVQRKDIPRLMACGLFGVAINQLFFFMGLSITTEINASLIMITTPILIIIFSHFILKEKITLRKVTGITFGALGAFLLIGFGRNFSFGSSTSLGDLFIFINASSYALYLVIVKPLMKKYHPLTVIKWVFLFGYIFIFPFGLNNFLSIQWANFTWEVWASVLFVVIFTTFFAYLLNIFALSKVNASVVSIYIYSQPLIATLVAILAGNDQLTLIKIISAICIFAGVYLVSFQRQLIHNKP